MSRAAPTSAEALEAVFGAVISCYSRAQAIEDGMLVDVTGTAAEAGFRFPVAMTRKAWAECVVVPDRCAGMQDEAGRLWDVVWMASNAIRRSSGGSEVRFSVYVRNHNGRATGRDLVTLKAVIGPGDKAEPVITIMFPTED